MDFILPVPFGTCRWFSQRKAFPEEKEEKEGDSRLHCLPFLCIHLVLPVACDACHCSPPWSTGKGKGGKGKGVKAVAA
eukprot:1148315-Pelagomonas_calceolata.AAC.1